jgi:hypothetical protein
VNAVEHALIAVLAAKGGDPAKAAAQIALAKDRTRATARRERQLVEIAALVVAGARDRAAGLALEHRAEFPDDAEMLTDVVGHG